MRFHRSLVSEVRYLARRELPSRRNRTFCQRDVSTLSYLQEGRDLDTRPGYEQLADRPHDLTVVEKLKQQRLRVFRLPKTISTASVPWPIPVVDRNEILWAFRPREVDFCMGG